MPLSKHVYFVATTFKMREPVKQRICFRFCVTLNIPPWKLHRWFRKAQLEATGDWQLHHNKGPAHASHLTQRFLVKNLITQVTQPHYIWIWHPVTSVSSPNWNHIWKGRDFRPSVRFRKIWQGSGWPLGELCAVPRCPLWRGLRWHCPMAMFLVSCIFLNKCVFFNSRWLDTFWTGFVY